MRREIEEQELIDRFLSGVLSGEEQKAVEEKLKKDNAFKEQVTFQKEVNNYILEYRLLKVKELAKAYSARSSGRSRYRGMMLGSIALLAVTAGIIYGIISDSKESLPLSDRSSSHLASHPPVPNLPISEGSGTDKKKEGKPIDGKAIITAPDKTEVADILQPSLLENPLPTVPVPEEEQHRENVPYEEKTTEYRQTDQIIPCKEIHMRASVNLTPSCEEQSTGTLFIASVSGGTYPYEYSLEEGAFESNQLFTDLAAGMYHLRIRDKNGCISLQEDNYRIAAKPCQRMQTFIISPADREVWKIPVTGNSNAKIRIFDKNGTVIHSFNIRNGYPQEWDGTDQTGSYLSPGTYIYLIESEDSKTEKGYITIIM